MGVVAAVVAVKAPVRAEEAPVRAEAGVAVGVEDAEEVWCRVRERERVRENGGMGGGRRGGREGGREGGGREAGREKEAEAVWICVRITQISQEEEEGGMEERGGEGEGFKIIEGM